MKKQKSLTWNFIMNVLLVMSSMIFPIITFPYVSRILLPKGTGKVSFAISLVSYFNMFAQMGIPTYGIQACAKVRDDRNKLTQTAQELVLINLLMSFISYVMLFVLLAFVPRFSEDRVLYIVISCTIFLNVIGVEWLYKALEEYTYIMVRSVIFKFMALVAIFLLIHQESDYLLYGVITIFASSASNILNFIDVHRYIDLKPLKTYNLKRHIKFVSIFFAMGCATTIYTHLDTFMLGIMTEDIEVGYYDAAIRIKNVLISLVTSLGTVLLPRSAYYVESREMDKFWEISRKALKFVLLVSVPGLLYFIIFAEPCILLLSGEAYMNSVIIMKVIMPTLLFIGLTNILGLQILVPLGKEKIVLYSEIAGAVVDLILNVILIPKIASVGAAIGTLVAEAVVLCVQFLALRCHITDIFRKLEYYKIAGASILGILASLWVLRLEIGYFSCLIISACLFFGIYMLSLIIMRENLTIEIIRNYLKGRL